MGQVVILLSTYNGENFLREQLDSVLMQDDVDIRVLVRDDGSSDGTIKILEEYQKQVNLSWYSGENMRPAKSFMHLLCAAPDADFYAFCDQDDVWMPEKLGVAIEKIQGANGPAMYCSDTLLVDSTLQAIRVGGIIADGTFAESLISNPATGCTMVFNKSLRDVAIRYIPAHLDMHDWWLYRICMAIGGYFYFDTTPHIKYRQHGNNVIGGQHLRREKIKRHIGRLFSSDEGIRLTMAKELHNGFYNQMNKDNQKVLDMFVTYKDSVAKTLKLAMSKETYISDQGVLNTFRNSVLLRKY